MPFNGSGGTSQPTSSVYPASANTLIESEKFNITIADIYSMLASCIVKDGQTTTTAEIEFSSGIATDDIAESSVGAGVTIDGLNIKDGAIAASAIAFTPAGSIAATDVQAAIEEVASEAIPAATIDAKGDLLVGTAADTVARKAVGANNTVLTAASGQADGLAWTDPNTLIAAASDTVAGKIEIATAAEVKNSTDATRAVTPATAGVHPSALKAYARFDVAANALVSIGLTGIVDEGTGLWTLNLASGLFATNLAVTVTADGPSVASGLGWRCEILSLTQVRIRTYSISTGEQSETGVAFMCVQIAGF